MADNIIALSAPVCRDGDVHDAMKTAAHRSTAAALACRTLLRTLSLAPCDSRHCARM